MMESLSKRHARRRAALGGGARGSDMEVLAAVPQTSESSTTRRRSRISTSHIKTTSRASNTDSSSIRTTANQLGTTPSTTVVTDQGTTSSTISSSAIDGSTTSTSSSADPLSTTFSASTSVLSAASSSSSSVSGNAIDASASQLTIHGLPKAETNAVIAIVCSVVGAVLLFTLLYFLCYRRRKSKEAGPSPLIGGNQPQFDAQFQDVDYPEATTDWQGRPRSFLESVESTLSGQSRFQSQTQPLSFHPGNSRPPNVGFGGPPTRQLTQHDPFRFGYGAGANTLKSALAGDLRNHAYSQQIPTFYQSDVHANPFDESAHEVLSNSPQVYRS